MFKYFVFAVICLASAAAAPGYLGGLHGAPALGLAAAPAISYGHSIAAPSYASYGLGHSYAAPALSHYGLGPRISYSAPALSHAPLALSHGPLALSHAPLGLSHGAPLGLGYKSYAAPALSLGHGW
ncbi:cuticle protein 16.5 [Drosophila grimshawi]|uniref:GH15869 n=1 Tax=Drosophila grimshawi TaxID=7222 RepID=B4J0C8_DROGR|nr:cuticle protein 16.5 [Drosophila grimshawi]EDV95729.1 GH15869 [Drosophila grimshawi]